MVLSLRQVVGVPGARQGFDFAVDLSNLSFPFGKPFAEPVRFVGEVQNKAGMLTLTAEISSNLHLHCDRCNRPFTHEKTLSVSQLLIENPSGEIPDDMIAFTGEQIDLEDALVPFWILDLEMQHLCSDDCPGLCPGCGARLSEENCTCVKAIDPRWEALRGYQGKP